MPDICLQKIGISF